MRCALYALYIMAMPLLAEPLAVSPSQIIHTNDIVTHISNFKNLIFVGNASGKIDVFKMDSNKKVHKTYSLTLPLIKDYFESYYSPRILDIATFDGQTLFVLSESSFGGRQILKMSNTQNPQVIFDTKSLPKRIAAFDKDKLVIGFLSNEIGLFDINKSQFIYKTQPSQASFSDLCVNAPFIFSTDESGAISVINITNGTLTTRIDRVNKDNNYQVVSSLNKILTAGVDRKMGIYTFDAQKTFSLTDTKYIQSEFLIYAVGISPSANLAALSKNEQNDLGIIHLPTLEEKYVLQGSKSLINTIIFHDEKTVIADSSDKTFIIWILKDKK